MTEIPLTKPCPECGRSGQKHIQICVAEELRFDRTTSKPCWLCTGRGYLPILYTPEQWIEAGGGLHDGMAVFVRHADGFGWWCATYKDAFAGEEIIVATPYITKKDLGDI